MSETLAIDDLVLREEEGLFSRDFDGQLVRMDKVTADDFAKQVTIKIDGRDVTVPKAVPLRDSQGTIIRDSDGQPTPRATTIYDAASELFVKSMGDRNPIPILCHQEHMNPVAVCRVCAVEIAKVKRGQMQRERKLLPACQHRVEETMEVQTIASPDLAARKRVHSSVQMLVEMLAADHLPADWEETYSQNELGLLVKRLDALSLEARQLEQRAAEKPLTTGEVETKWPLVDVSRFSGRTFDRGHDDSSRKIAIDHNQCILCDRCARGCDDIKQNVVIGRTGKGYTTTIGFDLDDPMGKSSCVSCGECMISCPTGALMFREQVVEPGEARSGTAVTADDLRKYPIFAGIPYKFLSWNAHSVERRQLKPGDVLCHEGEPGNTAFLLISGEFGVSIGDARHKDREQPGRWQAFVRQVATSMWGGGKSKRDTAQAQSVNIGGGKSLDLENGKWVAKVTPDDLILGEMSCLNHYPRSATVVATKPGEVLILNRNVLYMLQRNQQSRAILDSSYRRRALDTELKNMTIFRGLSQEEREACAALLRDRAELVRVDRGQVIFRQGDYATDFYKVRLGFVKVTQGEGGQERVLSYLGPGQNFGEIGLMSTMVDFSAELAALGVERATRTATCTALDDVELVRIRSEDFQEMVRRFPSAREALVKEARERLTHDVEVRKQMQNGIGQFLQNGLFSAQKLLVLDLESCTRCDECTRACSDTHDGITRLIREGLRFENFLVASSCRSCLDPYCLVGCPVDAIHRKPRENNPAALEIVIENHCIGCGQCSKNCPYGNISMHYEEDRRLATTCDLCRDIVGPNDDPSCVYACPHNAAFRMSGPELLAISQQRQATGGR